MACSKWVLPRPVPPWRKSGLNATLSAVGQRLGGAERDLVGLADDEILEPVARLERDRIKALGSGSRLLGAAPGSRPRRRCAARPGRRRSGSAHLGQLGPPGEREPLGEMGLHPIGHELGGQLEPERAGVANRSRRARSGAASRRRSGRRNRGEDSRESIPRPPRSTPPVSVVRSARISLAGVCTARAPLFFSPPLVDGSVFQAQNSPARRSRPRQAAARCDFAVCRRKIRPAGRSVLGSRGRVRSSEKNLSQQIKYR